MATNVTVYNGQLPQAPAAARADLAADRSLVDNFVSGIAMPLPRLSIKGREFALHWNGEVIELDKPLDVVLVNSSKANAKAFYVKGWTDDAADQPDCWSTDGVTPDSSINQPQAPACPGCQWNKFGSAPSRDGVGGKGKACADSRVLALIVPAQLHEDAANMGPFRLRVPVTTHATLRAYVEYLSKNGFPPNSCVTQLNFDRSVAYQKLTFTFVRPLTDKEYAASKVVRADDRTNRILAAPPEGEELSSANFAAPMQHASFGVGTAQPRQVAQDVEAKPANQPSPSAVQAMAKAQAKQDEANAGLKASLQKATATVQQKQVPPQVGDDKVIKLADGRYYSMKLQKIVAPPAPAVPPDEIIEDETGRLFNVTKGVYVNDGPDEAPQEEAQEDTQEGPQTATWQPPAQAPEFNPNGAQAQPEPAQEAAQEATQVNPPLENAATPKKRAGKAGMVGTAQPSPNALKEILSKKLLGQKPVQ